MWLIACATVRETHFNITLKLLWKETVWVKPKEVLQKTIGSKAGHHPSTRPDGENVRERVIISKSVPAKVGTKLAKIDVLAFM